MKSDCSLALSALCVLFKCSQSVFYKGCLSAHWVKVILKSSWSQITHVITSRWHISPPPDDSYHHLQMTHITTCADDSYPYLCRWLISPHPDDSYHNLQMTQITTSRRLISPPVQITHITTSRWLISPPPNDSYHHLQMTHITISRWIISPPLGNSDHPLLLTQLHMSLTTKWVWDWKKLDWSGGSDMGKSVEGGGDMGQTKWLPGLLVGAKNGTRKKSRGRLEMLREDFPLWMKDTYLIYLSIQGYWSV